MFVPFGTSHLLVLALVAGVAAALIALVRLWSAAWLIRIVRWALAAILMTGWGLWFLLISEQGWVSAGTLLPMQLCDWATIATAATLIYPNQRTYELGYFWVLGGTLQALLTPALVADYPDLGFLVFFVLHGGVIVSVLLLTLGLRMRPLPSSIPRIAVWSLAYLVSALAVNAIFGTNFGFLREKPAQPSLLDYLAPWPYYIAELALITVVTIAVLYAPFFVRDWIAGRRSHG